MMKALHETDDFKNINHNGRNSLPIIEKTYPTGLTSGERLCILAFLLQLEREKENVHYLEIGVLHGGTLRFLLDYTSSTSLTGIDLFDDFRPHHSNTHINEPPSIDTVKAYLGTRVSLIKNNSITALKILAEKGAFFDFIFLDGNHTYEALVSDLESCLPVLCHKGFIAFHDAHVSLFPCPKYIARDGGPWRITQELKKTPGFTLEEQAERLRVFSYHGTCLPESIRNKG